jgi:hypothetical protein
VFGVRLFKGVRLLIENGGYIRVRIIAFSGNACKLSHQTSGGDLTS